VISEPYEAKTIKAMMGVRPFVTATDENKAVGDSQNYLQRLRGITVVAASSSADLSTDSRAVAEHKKAAPKTALAHRFSAASAVENDVSARLAAYTSQLPPRSTRRFIHSTDHNFLG